MKKLFLVLALAGLAMGYSSCKKSGSDDTTTTTTGSTTTPTVAAERNQLVIDNVVYDIGAWGQPQSAGDYSFYGAWADTSTTLDLRALFNPLPDSTKTYNVTSSVPTANSGNVQLSLTYDATSRARTYYAVSGGKVDVTAIKGTGGGPDSTYVKFSGVTFKKQGFADKVISGFIAAEN